MSPDIVEHRDECTDPTRVGTFTGRDGDHLARCSSCGRVRVLETADGQTPATTPRPAPVAETRPEPSVKPLRIPAPDRHTCRQASRHGEGWPTHRARRRNALKRRHERARERAQERDAA